MDVLSAWVRTPLLVLLLFRPCFFLFWGHILNQTSKVGEINSLIALVSFLVANWMFWDRFHTWLISNSAYVTNQTHTWFSKHIFFEFLVKEKIFNNLRPQLNKAYHMSHNLKKTHQLVQNLSPECLSGLFNFSFTERLQHQGHWWHYDTHMFRCECNLVWIGEEVPGAGGMYALCISLGRKVLLKNWNPNPQYLTMVNLIPVLLLNQNLNFWENRKIKRQNLC